MSRLEAHDISFAYPDEAPVFEHLDFTVDSEERVALSAPSGCGKTTLCQLLAGYLQPQIGEVLLDGAPLHAPRGESAPVQLIWQHPEQAMDPYLRISVSLSEAGEVDEGLLSGLGVREEWLNRFPHELSGGELQRCCIARTLACNPRFLIADEISTMLDAITQAQICAFLLDWCAEANAGLVLVTHSPALQRRLATRVMRL